jgi:hypothetical protein
MPRNSITSEFNFAINWQRSTFPWDPVPGYQQFQNATRVTDDTVPLRPEQLQEARQAMDDRRQPRQQLMQTAEQPMEGNTTNVHNRRVRDSPPHLDNDPINNNWRN